MFSLILPFHNDAERLRQTLEEIGPQITRWPIGEILLCHNGPDMAQLKLAQSVAGVSHRVLHTDSKGIGAGYRLGIQHANFPYVILSASDLPFGFTDLEAYLKIDGDRSRTLAIGSKFASGSNIGNYPYSRKVVSRLFYLLRLALLGLDTPRDSQGTLILPLELAKLAENHVRADDYLFSLELIYVCQRSGIKIRELPVTLLHHIGPSSVSPAQDGWRMLKRLWRLRHEARALKLAI